MSKRNIRARPQILTIEARLCPIPTLFSPKKDLTNNLSGLVEFNSQRTQSVGYAYGHSVEAFPR